MQKYTDRGGITNRSNDDPVCHRVPLVLSGAGDWGTTEFCLVGVFSPVVWVKQF